MAIITLTNGNEIKQAPFGFSWTTLFFGGFPALFRGDFLIGVAVIAASFFTWGLAGLVFAFFYNEVYIKSLLEKGFVVKDFGGLSEDQVATKLGMLQVPKV